MVLVCSSCKNQITLEDSSVPEGIFKVRCTGCGKIITAQRNSSSSSSDIVEKTKQPVSEAHGTISPAIEAYIKKEIAAAKREILDSMQALFSGASIGKSENYEGGISQRALICSGDPLTLQSLSQAAKSLGYATETVVSAADSLKAVDADYALVLIDPSFSDDLEAGKKLIGRINARKAMERRKLFLVLISSSQKTLDGNAAFMNGVNLIVNKSELSALVPSIRQSQKDFQQMYSAFHAVSGERR